MIGYILLDSFKKFFMGKKLKDEIDKACVILNIENYNIADYFFTQLVQKN